MLSVSQGRGLSRATVPAGDAVFLAKLETDKGHAAGRIVAIGDFDRGRDDVHHALNAKAEYDASGYWNIVDVAQGRFRNPEDLPFKGTRYQKQVVLLDIFDTSKDCMTAQGYSRL